MTTKLVLFFFLALLCIIHHVNAVDSNATCADCERIATALGVISMNDTDIEILIQELDVACKKANFADKKDTLLCQTITTKLAQSLPWVHDQLMDLEWNSPEAVCSYIGSCIVDCCNTKNIPEQVRLAFTNTSHYSEMMVTWTVFESDPSGIIEYGTCSDIKCLTSSSIATPRTYTRGGWNGNVYSGVMVGLEPSTKYYYRVGSYNNIYSKVYYFNTLPKKIGDANRPLKAIWIGDMAYDSKSDDTVKSITKMVNENNIDVVFHIGDISYADGYQRHWDAFMRKVEPISSQVPYMVCPGNHEFWFQFASYKTRYTMPNWRNTNSMYYSFDIDNVHFSSLNTETDIDTPWISKTQQEWLINDLNDNKNSAWKFTYGHRPLYCTDDPLECDKEGALLQSQAEDIFHTNKVDVYISGHVHNYERTYPIYKNTTTSQSYAKPSSTTYIISGAAGNREGNSTPDNNKPWSIAGSNAVSYGLMIVNGTNMTYKQRESGTDKLLDSFTITK